MFALTVSKEDLDTLVEDPNVGRVEIDHEVELNEASRTKQVSNFQTKQEHVDYGVQNVL